MGCDPLGWGGDIPGIWKKKMIMGHKRGCFWGSPNIGRREGARGGDKGREGVGGGERGARGGKGQSKF